jgi:MinD-like ATPase involved in chromosome partitioning or flagellar assembly
MQVIAFASRKGGAGKTTLAAAGCMTDGRTVGELDPTSRSAAEITGLWSYIHNILVEDESYGEVGTRAA